MKEINELKALFGCAASRMVSGLSVRIFDVCARGCLGIGRLLAGLSDRCGIAGLAKLERVDARAVVRDDAKALALAVNDVIRQSAGHAAHNRLSLRGERTVVTAGETGVGKFVA